jgi:hypothetical protein
MDGRLAVDEMSVIAYQGVLAKSRLLGTPITEFVPVIVARMVHSAIRLEVGVKSHRPIEAGKARFDSWRRGILRRRTIIIESFSENNV